MGRLENAPNFRPVIFNVKVCPMSKLVQAASIIALAAVASTAGAWYNGPPAPVMPPEMAEQQMQALSAHHQAMAELGPFPEMPDYPGLHGMQGPSEPEHMKTRLDERDAYRAKVQQDMQERRAAFKAMSEQRRAEFKRAVDRSNRAGYAHRMHPAMMSGKDCTPATQAPEQQATAASPATVVQ
jgi:hypothetical protein